METNTWVPVGASKPIASRECFQTALRVWIDKPHTINRRLAGVKPRWERSLPPGGSVPDEDDSFVRRLNAADLDALPSFFADNTVPAKRSWKEGVQVAGFVLERDLLPKQIDKFGPTREVVAVFDDCAVFRNVSGASAISPSVTYRLRLSPDDGIHLELFGLKSADVDDSGVAWLREHVLPKVARWASSEPVNSKQVLVPSLNQVCIERYNAIYFNLKKKHGKHLCKIWPETTDPLKYVYEDISIASYLLTLWEQEKDEGASEPPTFVDVGCGNGLLVYLLAAEGYKGVGIDVRKRKIWDLYGPKTRLLEQAITPEVRLPEYSWWIGNHSDELTPWIPYLASRSRPDARVFLLPCCPFGFHGKYQRQHGNMSQYQSYLLFLQDLCRGLRFSVQLDRLRIPSTKRICLVCKPSDAAGDAGFGAGSPAAWKSVPDRIRWPSADPGESRTETAGDSNDGHGTEGFKPREGVEAVRNCTQLDRSFLDSTVDLIAKRLLQAEATDGEALPDRDHWNRGGVMHLRDLVQLLTEKDLQTLKSQCGGLQTLIRNHRHIFLVQKGLVSLNVPSTETRRRIQSKSGPASKCPPRKKQCWFFAHHPQGCPLTADSCHFLHGA
ncbi:hypothetical protein HPB47_007524 [Ixodes persulcatus]|uniref:Uncharacterized protein n=1 Tax=Ixodes persulcatus TaxID=34615 RepID=A0AC60P867_IXOPE|nr:hypothetical protein HPB47_007524 [Ixodes persulcatus]